MYTTVNILPKIGPSAEQFIMDNDRMLYRVFFELTERFCAEHHVIIGGRIGADLLVGRAFTKDSFQWDLYCDDAFANAKLLTGVLATAHSPHIPARTVALDTNIKHKEFTISVNARPLFKIFALDKYRGVDMAKLMKPPTRPGYFTESPMLCISEELQLIDMYRALYSPSHIADWATDLETESALFPMVCGAGRDATINASPANKPQHASICAIHAKLMSYKDPRDHDYVLIGDLALLMRGIDDTARSGGHSSRLQFITGAPIESVVVHFDRVIKGARGTGRTGGAVSGGIVGGSNGSKAASMTASKIIFARYLLNIPGDFQIVKYTLYLTTGKDQTPLADVFNSAQYELIPFTPITYENQGAAASYRVANLWVLMRFLFIDIWALRLIAALSGGSPDAKISTRKASAAAVRACIVADVASTFQLVNYTGVYVNEAVAKKKLIKALGDRFPPYYPAQVKKLESR
jgi:hypothetical protein